MSIREMNLLDIPDTLKLWNNLVLEKEVLYQQLSPDAFKQKFINSNLNVEIISYIHIDNEVINGFISGVISQNKDKAYITSIVIDSKYRRKGIASKLLTHFEHYISSKHPSIKTIDLVFFNPIQLEWIIPDTVTHIHPNAPGVNYQGAAYFFFKHHNYLEYAKQNVYYRNILNYSYSDSILDTFKYLLENDISITFYDQKKHTGLNELFIDLKNTNWKEEITKAILHHEVVLVAETKNKIIGFAGPLKVESNLRGYFAGIGIHSNYRGFGVGKALFSTLCMELKNIGAHYMSLFTGETNQARYIYEKESFKIVRSWANMRKDL